MTEEQMPQPKLFLDEKSFLAEWMFNPDIKEDADFAHLDKNLALTRLSSRYGEPERARALLEALHTLTKTIYYYEIEEDVLTGYERRDYTLMCCEGCGAKYESEEIVDCIKCEEKANLQETIVKEIPVYSKVKKRVSYYPKAYHTLKAKFYSLTTTASARDGHLIKSATTNTFRREDSIEDKTAVKGRWGMGSNNKQQQRY